MKLSRVGTILWKDLSKGPRSPFFLWVLVIPLLLTLIFKTVFGTFFERAPVLGVVAPADAAVLRALDARPGLEVRRVADADTLWRLVDEGEVELGWVVPPGFEEALARGERPVAQVQLGGDTLASHRVVLALAVAETVRQVEGVPAPLEVSVHAVGDEPSRSLLEQFLPVVVILSILISGVFLPAFSLVDERQKGALTAMLVTPATMGEVLLAKGALGFGLSLVAGFATLALNGALPADPLPMLAVFVVAGLMLVELGLLLGSLAKDTSVLFTIWKGSAWLLMLPLLAFLWSGFPRWVAMLSPTWWFISPTWKVAMEGKGLADVASELGVALGLVAALFVVVRLAARRVERTIGAS